MNRIIKFNADGVTRDDEMTIQHIEQQSQEGMGDDDFEGGRVDGISGSEFEEEIRRSKEQFKSLIQSVEMNFERVRQRKDEKMEDPLEDDSFGEDEGEIEDKVGYGKIEDEIGEIKRKLEQLGKGTTEGA